MRRLALAWGHCIASPGINAKFAAFLDRAISQLLD